MGISVKKEKKLNGNLMTSNVIWRPWTGVRSKVLVLGKNQKSETVGYGREENNHGTTKLKGGSC
jgi:hypothetical protein